MSWSFTTEITRRLAMLSLAIVMASSVGCIMTYDPDSVSLADVTEVDQCQPSARSLTVSIPAPGMVLEPNGDGLYILEVKVTVCGVDLVATWGQTNVANEGHLTVSIDHIMAHPADQGIAGDHFGIQLPPEVATPGTHTLRVTVRNNDLTDSGIPAVERSFTVAAGGGK
jgi:hypothetical protein